MKEDRTGWPQLPEKPITAGQLRTSDRVVDGEAEGGCIAITRISYGGDGEVVMVTYADGEWRRYHADETIGVVREPGDTREEVTWQR